MRNFKRFIAFVLCAVMLVGVMPMAFTGPNAVVAESGVDAVVQGPNDAVIIYDVDLTLREVFGAFVDNKVLVNGEKLGVGGTTNGAAYDRIIFVMAISDRLGYQDSTAFESSDEEYFFNHSENIVITSACYAEHTENVYLYTSKAIDGLKQYGEALASGKEDPFTDNLIDKTDSVVFRLIEDGSADFVRIACDLSFEYITLKFDANILFYLAGYDFYVSDTVTFTYNAATDGYKPIIVNGTNGSGTNTTTNKYNTEKTQTITLNGGEYQYIAPRSRNVTYKSFEDYDITLNLGEVSFLRNSNPNVTAFFTNDYFDNTKMTVNINGTTFKAPVYLVQGSTNTKATAPTVIDSTLNINVTYADFQQGVAVVAPDSGTASCDVQSLTVNMHIAGCTVGDGYTIQGQTDATASAITANVEYTKGAPFADKLVNFDNSSTFEGNLCAGGHTLGYYLDEGAPICGCIVCYEPLIEVSMKEGRPMVYVSGTAANTNDGMTAETPVGQISQAFDILENWKMGGYIQLVGNVSETTNYTFGTTAGTKWGECGALVIIDGAYDDVEAATLTCPSGQIQIFNDVEMRNIKLAAVSGHKAFTLNYHNFKAVDNCTMVNPESYNYSLMLGSTNGFGTVPTYATDRDVDQTVEIDGFNFMFISAGSKSFAVTSTEAKFSREYSVRCTGTSNVYIGPNSHIDAINVRGNWYDGNPAVHNPSYTAPKPIFHISKSAVDLENIKFVENCTSGASVRTISNKKFADAGLYVCSDDIENIASVIGIYDADAFAHVSNGYNEAASLARITFAEVENSLQGDEIAEFGVLFTVPEMTDDIHYVYATGDQGLIAKSRAYDKANEVTNYFYDGVNAAYFHGVIVLDNPALSDVEFAATPYAVVDVAEADGVEGSVAAQYCVMGETSNAVFADLFAAE
ncbi:MAG: hypothetical protein IJF74_01270 [Clostridia bacterium]|nr:hypothetical protein [Clostridia bacterium]